MRWAAIGQLLAGTALSWALARGALADAPAGAGRMTGACPAEMARVTSFCIDRWEASLVDQTTGRALSPYYPPEPRRLAQVHELWRVERHQVGDDAARAFPLPEVPEHQLASRFEPRAVSRAAVVPHAYLTYHAAKRACENAGKRLCKEEEWLTACRGQHRTKYPYGNTFTREKCNVYRFYHPAFVLHGISSSGLTDPRLNLVRERGVDPVLRATGATPSCASVWGDAALYDMVGNLDEWIDDDSGVFVGGFYARATMQGCQARIASHAPSYYDYSIGTRCCRDAR